MALRNSYATFRMHPALSYQLSSSIPVNLKQCHSDESDQYQGLVAILTFVLLHLVLEAKTAAVQQRPDEFMSPFGT
jgi:hypothetical protein